MNSLVQRPTPVQRVDALCTAACDLWVKRDDLTNASYGGNKARKLERILADARTRGAERLVTIGAAGSHHVLATAYFGARAGFEVEAVLVPQPRTRHVVDNLRAGVGLGLRVVPASSWAAGGAKMIARGRGAYTVALGGSSVVGSTAYVDAARELAKQVRSGEMPEPDVVVVALGSGGTAAGLAAGFAAEKMRTRVVGVVVSRPVWWLRRIACKTARECARLAGAPMSRAEAAARLECDDSQLGAGYAAPTEAGARAIEIAQGAGLVLDATYTAKAFAAALALVAAGRDRTVLFWHTLSSAPMAPLLAGAPEESALDASVRALLL